MAVYLLALLHTVVKLEKKKIEKEPRAVYFFIKLLRDADIQTMCSRSCAREAAS